MSIYVFVVYFFDSFFLLAFYKFWIYMYFNFITSFLYNAVLSYTDVNYKDGVVDNVTDTAGALGPQHLLKIGQTQLHRT